MNLENRAEKDDELLAVDVELEDDGSDILKECFGGCGKKILIFGPGLSEEWGDGVAGALCLECKAKSITGSEK